MKDITIDQIKITPEQKKTLLENHQAGIVMLTTIILLVKNPILKTILAATVTLIDFVCDKLLLEAEKPV